MRSRIAFSFLPLFLVSVAACGSSTHGFFAPKLDGGEGGGDDGSVNHPNPQPDLTMTFHPQPDLTMPVQSGSLTCSDVIGCYFGAPPGSHTGAFCPDQTCFDTCDQQAK